MAEGDGKPTELSPRRQAILSSLIPVVPSVSGDPDRKFFQITGREDDAIESLKASAHVTTCLDLIGYCARAAGAVRGKHKIASGAMQLQEARINLGGWVERVYDPSTDPVVQMVRAGNKAALGGLGAVAPTLAGLKRGIAGMKPPGLLDPTPPLAGWAPTLTVPTLDAIDLDAYIAARKAEKRVPRPGDFFQIRTSPTFVKHVGVIVKVDGGLIKTAEAGQAEKRMAPLGPDGKREMIPNPLKKDAMMFKMVNKEAAKSFDRQYNAETGRFFTNGTQDNGFLFGWIDVDLMKLD